MDREEFGDRLSTLIAEARADVSAADIMAVLVTRVRVLLAIEFEAGYNLDESDKPDDGDSGPGSGSGGDGGSANPFRIDDDLR